MLRDDGPVVKAINGRLGLKNSHTISIDRAFMLDGGSLTSMAYCARDGKCRVSDAWSSYTDSNPPDIIGVEATNQELAAR